MQLINIQIKNFKTLKDVHILPGSFAIFVGANGSGKSTFFEVFEFLRDAFKGNVNIALQDHGGGFDEVRSRDCEGDIEIRLGFRNESKKPKQENHIIYTLKIGKDKNGKAIVNDETLAEGILIDPLTPVLDKVLSFRKGFGYVLTGIQGGMTEAIENKEDYRLASPDRLAISAFSIFDKFPTILAIGDFIEGCHFSDIHIDKAKSGKKLPREQLSASGDNLFNVVDYYCERYPEKMKQINESLKQRIPGVTDVKTEDSDNGVLLKVKEQPFGEPFLIDHVSHGTVKMLAYLLLLNDPNPHELLCIEEPENQLYHSFLEELAEEFRAYAARGKQVFVTTHSPEILNAAKVEEVFLLVKKEGYTTIVPAVINEQIRAYMENGDKMGHLWREGFFDGVGPNER